MIALGIKCITWNIAQNALGSSCNILLVQMFR